MKAFISGGTGFIGVELIKRLLEENFEITLLSRSKKIDSNFTGKITHIVDDPNKPGDWQKYLANQDIVINLAGMPIFKRWTKKIKKDIYESRVITTRNIAEGLIKYNNKKILFFNASAIGYYGFHDDKIITEQSSSGNDFLAKITESWEEEAIKAEKNEIRVILCRIGVVLGKNKGAFKELSRNIKFYSGFPLGTGKQWVSWIHIDDVINIFMFLIKNKSIRGPVNITAPNPVTNSILTKKMSKLLNRPSFLPPVPSFIIKLLLGGVSEILLNGSKVMPKKLLPRRSWSIYWQKSKWNRKQYKEN